MFEVYRKAVPDEFFDSVDLKGKAFSGGGVFGLAVVAYLMMFQRVNPKGTASVAVQEGMRGPIRDLVRHRKRIAEGTLSGDPGAYCKARKNFPVELAATVADRISDYLSQSPQTWPGLDRRVYLLDGTTVRLPHTAELAAAFPPAGNQHGVSHWPLMRVLVATDLLSGVALRPCWGPTTTSEQALAHEALDRLPPRSVLVDDGNFGVFSVCYKARTREHDVVTRLTVSRATKILGEVPVAGTDRKVRWTPSAADRKTNPELPPEAELEGRVLVFNREHGGKSTTWFIFTTLDQPAREILALYGYRWDVETDLRSLKRDFRIHMLSAKSTAMVEKELLFSVAGYNLVRAAMIAAATQLHLNPRQLSFSRVQDAVNAFLPEFARASSEQEREFLAQQFVRAAGQCKLPRRTKRRCPPRAVWSRSSPFPSRTKVEKEIQ